LPSSLNEDFFSLELKKLLVLVVPDNLGLPADLGLAGIGCCIPTYEPFDGDDEEEIDVGTSR
jgi:hypothetical protein